MQSNEARKQLLKRGLLALVGLMAVTGGGLYVLSAVRMPSREDLLQVLGERYPSIEIESLGEDLGLHFYSATWWEKEPRRSVLLGQWEFKLVAYDEALPPHAEVIWPFVGNRYGKGIFFKISSPWDTRAARLVAVPRPLLARALVEWG